MVCRFGSGSGRLAPGVFVSAMGVLSPLHPHAIPTTKSTATTARADLINALIVKMFIILTYTSAVARA
jgi:hypothetical protein